MNKALTVFAYLELFGCGRSEATNPLTSRGTSTRAVAMPALNQIVSTTIPRRLAIDHWKLLVATEIQNVHRRATPITVRSTVRH